MQVLSHLWRFSSLTREVITKNRPKQSTQPLIDKSVNLSRACPVSITSYYRKSGSLHQAEGIQPQLTSAGRTGNESQIRFRIVTSVKTFRRTCICISIASSRATTSKTTPASPLPKAKNVCAFSQVSIQTPSQIWTDSVLFAVYSSQSISEQEFHHIELSPD
jgi:hypothetical protein